MLDKDHALVIPRRAEAALLSEARLEPSLTVHTLFGLQVWYVRSRPGAPWHTLTRFGGEDFPW
jgi:hypothetical protein